MITTTTDNRNVIDHFKYWNDDAIKAALDTKRTKLIVACENFGNDFNIATVIRNVNAFTAKEVWIVGRRKYDKRGTVGTHNYEHLKFAKTFDEVDLQPINDHDHNYEIVAVEQTDDAENIETFNWNPYTCLVFGQEQVGVSQETLDKCRRKVYIPQRGSTRSLNVGVASGIAIYEYTKMWG